MPDLHYERAAEGGRCAEGAGRECAGAKNGSGGTRFGGSFAGGLIAGAGWPERRESGQARGVHAHADRAASALEILIARAARRKRTSGNIFRAKNFSIKIKIQELLMPLS
jgi:hypothetical protein